ncbi:MAG: hypothetical protein WBF33_19190 [Candidatus Nitrosopolaris sp.]|jgi:hypothetical protein
MYLSGDLDIINMARIDLSIDDKLDTQFRDMVYKTMGMKRGNLRIALEEAIKIWLSSKKGSGRVR